MSNVVSIHKAYAPKCCHPSCSTQVGYHNKKRKTDGSWSYKWKSFCEYHRTDVVGKSLVDAFKASRGGCESQILGWPCPGHHGDLTIDHYDGDKHNNNEDNLLVLCPNCHAKKTKLYGDNRVRYNNVQALPAHLWDITA